MRKEEIQRDYEVEEVGGVREISREGKRGDIESLSHMHIL